MKRTILALAALGALTALPAEAQFDEGLPVGSKAPVVVVNDLDGNPFDLGTVIGKKPVFLEFWATWCTICEELLPTVKAVHRKYGDRVEWIGVNVTVNQSVNRVRRYLETHEPPFRTLYDSKGAAVRAYEAPTTSHVVVVNAQGIVVYTGSGGKQDLEAAIKLALGDGGGA